MRFGMLSVVPIALLLSGCSSISGLPEDKAFLECQGYYKWYDESVVGRWNAMIDIYRDQEKWDSKNEREALVSDFEGMSVDQYRSVAPSGATDASSNLFVLFSEIASELESGEPEPFDTDSVDQFWMLSHRSIQEADVLCGEGDVWDD